MKKKIIIIVIILLLLSIVIYINPIRIIRNKQITNNINTLKEKDYITKKDLIPFEYDEIHFLYPYTTKKDIEEYIGIKSRFIKENNNDNHYNLIIVKNNKVISNPSIPMNITIQLLKAKEDTIIKILKEDGDYSFIEQNKFITDTYQNIWFTLPGSYWEEDNEELHMYYLDIDRGEYLSIVKEDKIDKIKYEEQTINDNIVYYKEELYNITYIIYIKDKYYNFTLYSSKEYFDKDKEDLYKIIESIK